MDCTEVPQNFSENMKAYNKSAHFMLEEKWEADYSLKHWQIMNSNSQSIY